MFYIYGAEYVLFAVVGGIVNGGADPVGELYVCYIDFVGGCMDQYMFILLQFGADYKCVVCCDECVWYCV